MNFPSNLQYLRSERNLTQERLAMLLGVSRQSISKWESGKAYPELDKLTVICDLFGCTLDDLVMGDVSESRRGTANISGPGRSEANGSSSGISCPEGDSISPATDMTGYDEHCRRFSLMVPGGIAAIIWGVAGGMLFDESNSVLGSNSANGFLMFLCIAVGVVVGLALMIPACMWHDEFQRRHPFIEDFYTDDDHARATRYAAIGVTCGIALILTGVSAMVWVAELQGVSDGWPVGLLLALVAPGVGAIVHAGMRKGLMDINDYNKNAEQKRRERAGERDFYDQLTGGLCGIVMIVATIVGLVLMSAGGQMGRGLFWLAWPVGGLVCGVIAIVIGFFRDAR